MGIKSNCCNFCILFAVLLGVLISWNENFIDKKQDEEPKFQPKYLDLKWSDIGNNMPKCYRPMVIRNAFSFPYDCKSEEDLCDTLMRKRFVDYFGDRTIGTYPPTHITYAYNQTSQPDFEWIKFKDYLLNPKYINYTVHSLQQLGTQEEYSKFFSFENTVENNFMNFVDASNGEIYSGIQFFFGNGKYTGSNLHYAPALTLSTQMIGRKRWLMISPYFYDTLNCISGKQGLYGQCYPNNYTHTFGEVSIDKFKDIILNDLKIPEKYVIDITLYPGDVLINCELWEHIVQNLDDRTSAASIRYAVDLQKDIFSIKAWSTHFRSLYTAAITKYDNPNEYTFIDSMYEVLIKGTKSLLDKDPRFKLTSIMNQHVKK